MTTKGWPRGHHPPGPEAAEDAGAATTASTIPPGRFYAEKICTRCTAPFIPASGRQLYCSDCRAPKLRTERDTESKRARRVELEQPTAEQMTRPPTRLPVLGSHRRRDRVEWVAAALRLARHLHHDHRLGWSQIVVGWAERTANGELELIGCHHLGSLVDHVDFGLYGPHVSAIATRGLSPTEANADVDARLSPAETPPELSDSAVVRRPGPAAVNCSSMTGAAAHEAAVKFSAYWDGVQ